MPYGHKDFQIQQWILQLVADTNVVGKKAHKLPTLLKFSWQARSFHPPVEGKQYKIIVFMIQTD